MDEQAKIKAIDKVLENIDSKVTGRKLQPSSAQHDEDA
jgi:hypothetical protein